MTIPCDVVGELAMFLFDHWLVMTRCSCSSQVELWPVSRLTRSTTGHGSQWRMRRWVIGRWRRAKMSVVLVFTNQRFHINWYILLICAVTLFKCWLELFFCNHSQYYNWSLQWTQSQNHDRIHVTTYVHLKSSHHHHTYLFLMQILFRKSELKLDK